MFVLNISLTTTLESMFYKDNASIKQIHSHLSNKANRHKSHSAVSIGDTLWTMSLNSTEFHLFTLGSLQTTIQRTERGRKLQDPQAAAAVAARRS
jgi:hypothetical protein